MRESPSLVLVRALFAAGAKVRAYDPVASTEALRILVAEHGEAVCKQQLRIVESASAAADDSDVLVLVTEWKEFRSPDFGRLATVLRRKAVFDGRNIYDPEAVAAAGLSYEGIGRTSLGVRL